jgi:hypothetical protein
MRQNPDDDVDDHPARRRLSPKWRVALIAVFVVFVLMLGLGAVVYKNKNGALYRASKSVLESIYDQASETIPPGRNNEMRIMTPAALRMAVRERPHLFIPSEVYVTNQPTPLGSDALLVVIRQPGSGELLGLTAARTTRIVSLAEVNAVKFSVFYEKDMKPVKFDF